MDLAISPGTNSARADVHERLNTQSIELGSMESTEKRRKARMGASAFRAAGILMAAVFVANAGISTPEETAPRYYLGFDRNDYPGDDAMKLLRRDFVFNGYWLGNPPGENQNSWSGKREFLRSLGFGFLVLYRGREEHELANVKDPIQFGGEEAETAAQAAKREGFPSNTIIFLDIEEGGRLSPAYHSYIQGWLWTLTQRGFQGGFYCSGIQVREDAQSTITTADDIMRFLFPKSRAFSMWVFNDSCPPSPGCVVPKGAPAPSRSGMAYAQIWQFVRSPRDKQTARHCQGYAKDGNCYSALDSAHRFHLDVNSATSPDPSGGAR